MGAGASFVFIISFVIKPIYFTVSKYIFYQPPIFAKNHVMTIAILGSQVFVEELKNTGPEVIWLPANTLKNALEQPHADAWFFEKQPDEIDQLCDLHVPVFINCVDKILTVKKNIIYFNGWPGFVAHDTWEVSGEINDDAKNILNMLGKKYIQCSTEPGFISARIIAMIINEAFLAKAEGVSTEQEIDIAMKLGTNYPYGPFEWAERIGYEKIISLLQNLAATDTKYEPAASLIDKTVFS